MRRFTVSLVLSVVVIHASCASKGLGEAFYPVDLSGQANWTWSAYETAPGQPSGVYLPGAPIGPTTLGGVPFNIKSNDAGNQAWNAYIDSGGGSGQKSMTIDVNAYGVTDVYTLINTFMGTGGPNSYASLVFTGSGGATYTKALLSDVDIRDYNLSGAWANQINGTTTTNVFSCTDIWGRPGVLDMQDIALPAAFSSQTLTTIQLIDNGGPGLQRVVLDGVTAASSVPEPSGLVLLGVGAISLSAYAWRRRRD
jgi:hypothetical protein